MFDFFDQVSDAVQEEVPGLNPEIELIVGIIEDAINHGRQESVTGMVIHGPTGTGKSMLIDSILRHLPQDIGRVTIDCTTLYGKREGDAEAALFTKFKEVWSESPAICVIEGIESIGASDLTSVTSKRMRALFCRLLDVGPANNNCFYLATTNQPESLDESIVEYGRLEYMVRIEPPEEERRLSILTHLSRKVIPVASEESRAARDALLRHVANRTHSFVGADLMLLIREAFHASMRRLYFRDGGFTDIGKLDAVLEAAATEGGETGKLAVDMEDFQAALAVVEASSLTKTGSEFVPEAPPGEPISSLGGVDKMWQRLKVAIVRPMRAIANGKPTPELEVLQKIGVGVSRGVLLHGPSGTGKTKLALALAHELHGEARFMNVACNDLVRAEHGSSEKAIKAVFVAARRAAPCVLLLDQIDIIAQRRRIGADGPSQASEHTMDRILSLLLIEIDGAASGAQKFGDAGAGLLIVATTHDKELLEPALLRPGRIDQHVEMGYPDLNARIDIFRKLLGKFPMSLDDKCGDTFDGLVEKLAHGTEGFSCAGLHSVCQEAAMTAMREDSEGVAPHHLFERIGFSGASAESDPAPDSAT